MDKNENKILDGKKLSLVFKENILKIIKNLETKPKLVIFLTTDNYSSKKYVEIKTKIAKELGILVELIYFPECSKNDFFSLLEKKNNDPSVDGILVQFPITKNLDEKEVLSSINPEKDVDAISPLNIGLNLQNNLIFLNPVVKALKTLAIHYQISFSGKNCVVVSTSNIVGKPIIGWLINQNATVLICNKFTKDIKKIIKFADILITAVGKKNFITADMIKKDAIIFDIGINKNGNKVTGDVKISDDLWKSVKYITPVPGGVGPLTVIFLLQNLLFFHLKNNNCLEKYEI